MPAPKSKPPAAAERDATDGLGSAQDQIASRVFHPLDLVMLTRDRIQETLDDFAQRGRVTRSDANELVAELVRRGREQTDDILGDLEQLLDQGRDQLEAATKKARARRTVGVGPAFPIIGYDDLTAGQVDDRLAGLTPPQLRKVRDYERRHANRKTVLHAIEKALS